jgi:uncharacterized protein (TIGR02996 family)
MKEEAFLWGLREEPDDSALRLIFADWLEEQADPRGELLRLTHALTHPLDYADRPALENRLRALLAEGVQPVGPRWTNELGMAFVWVPPGVFRMGGPPQEVERQANEVPHHATLTRGFYLSVHAVTQAQWRAVFGSNPSRFPGDDRPVECVSWHDCQEFCQKLSQKTGLGQEGPSPYRLPTEAEWEYACRAGTTTPFFFGQTLSEKEAKFHTNYHRNPEPNGNGRPETAPVDAFPANAWGLCGMHGNVFEWCADWYAPYPSEAVQDPSGPALGDVRVLRGGSWHSLALRCRSACRGWAAPGYRGSDVGFRVRFRVDHHYVI